jgi:hypothetical protein
MKLKKILAAVAAVCVLAAPAMALAAAARTTQSGGPSASAARIASHRRAVAHNLRLARLLAQRSGRPLPDRYARAARLRPTPALQRSNVRLRTRLDRLRAARVAGRRALAGLRGLLASIARCESHGNPRAIGGGGRYRGAYQFDLSTWRSVGGRGDPARASLAEQTRRAALLYRRVGRSAWPICGR